MPAKGSSSQPFAYPAATIAGGWTMSWNSWRRSTRTGKTAEPGPSRTTWRERVGRSCSRNVVLDGWPEAETQPVEVAGQPPADVDDQRVEVGAVDARVGEAGSGAVALGVGAAAAHRHERARPAGVGEPGPPGLA